MRSDRELITLLKLTIEDAFNNLYRFGGMCHILDNMLESKIISYQEYKKIHKILKKYIVSNNIFTRIVFNKDRLLGKNRDLLGYWWYPGDKQPRLKYLQYLLDKKYK